MFHTILHRGQNRLQREAIFCLSIFDVPDYPPAAQAKEGFGEGEVSHIAQGEGQLSHKLFSRSRKYVLIFLLLFVRILVLLPVLVLVLVVALVFVLDLYSYSYTYCSIGIHNRTSRKPYDT